MFAKLLKYEWKSSAGLLGILSLAALGVGLAGGGALRYLFVVVESVGDGSSNGVVMLPLMFLVMFMMLALLAYVIATQIILLSRFYKSRFTDEGYLTFTLPVSTWQNYLSALTNILIWDAISGLVMFVAMGLLVFIGASGVPGFEGSLDMTGITQGYRELFAVEGYAQYQLLSMIHGVVSFFAAPVIIMTCITLGAVLAKKHKILAAIGLYYAASMVVGMATSISTAVIFVEELEMSATPYSGTALLAVGIQILVQLALCVGGSFLSVHLMDKKLNLP